MNEVQHQVASYSLSQSALPRVPTTLILRLAVVSGTGSRNSVPSLPSVQRTLPLAESIHRALIRKAGKGRRVDCPELTGQDQYGQPLIGSHRHAHVLPVDTDGDGALDHVVIYAPMGLRHLAQEAIHGLKTLFGSGGDPWLRLQCIDSPMLNRWLVAAPYGGVVDSKHFRDPTSQSDRPREHNGTAEWVSMTPFVPPRYIKKSGKNSLVGQIKAELASRNYPTADVTVLETLDRNSFDLQRHPDHAQPPQRIAYRLRLTFVEPVVGPICLGYGSHFGLGLFRANTGHIA